MGLPRDTCISGDTSALLDVTAPRLGSSRSATRTRIQDRWTIDPPRWIKGRFKK
jgi:hypothetical protein